MTPEERTESRRANAAKARAALAAKRASGEVKPYTRREKVAPEPAVPAVWSFNVDDKGELAIVDTNDGSGIELSVTDAQRLRAFLARALPRELADMTLSQALRESPTPEQFRAALVR